MKEKDLCDLCGGELEHKKIDLEVHIQKELIICEDLPADICKQCGEKYFSADVSSKIDIFIKRYQKKRPSRYILFGFFRGGGVEVGLVEKRIPRANLTKDMAKAVDIDTPAFTGGVLFTGQAALVLCLPLSAFQHTSLLFPH